MCKMRHLRLKPQKLSLRGLRNSRCAGLCRATGCGCQFQTPVIHKQLEDTVTVPVGRATYVQSIYTVFFCFVALETVEKASAEARRYSI